MLSRRILYKTKIALLMVSLMLLMGCISIFPRSAVAASATSLNSGGVLDDETEFSPLELARKQNRDYAVDKEYIIPGGKGTLTANAWRTRGDGKKVGNTRQWDYQVSAVYSGYHQVEYIKTSWQAGASLSNSASLTIGLGMGETVSASSGGSSSWQYVTPTAKYYMNTKGQREVSYRSNMYVAPEIDYRSGSISIVNTAIVKLAGDSTKYQITAAY